MQRKIISNRIAVLQRRLLGLMDEKLIMDGAVKCALIDKHLKELQELREKGER